MTNANASADFVAPAPISSSKAASAHACNSERFIPLEEVELSISLKKSTIYAMVASGTFPPPVQITPTARAWVMSEVQNWMTDRINSRSKPTRTDAHCGVAA
jgi:prophage regulatory protein